jgi:segregation and condensation protein A
MTDPLADGIPGLGEDDADDDETRADDALAEGFEETNGHSDVDVVEETNGHSDVDVVADDSTDDGDASAPSAIDDEDGAAPSAIDDEEVEPVEVLVGLAEEGKIDPWDIDIVEVTDAFLDRLDEGDLRTSGRALFYASVLLRMKGDELLEPDEPDDPEEEPWEAAMRGGDGAVDPEHVGDPVAALEDEMDRRLERRSTRGTPETLDELVRELREAERGSWWKESREYDTSESPSGFQRGTQTLDYRAGDDLRGGGEPTEGDVTGTTHEEDIEDVIDDVRDALRPHYEAGREEVLFTEISNIGTTTVRTFLALLFLANRGEVELQQDDLFGDLWIADATATVASDEAIAD